ncbi:LpxL/LpxP family Kdo(2)-lipid IV(A) lauroyl/palmitoleoyl acyltransferase [Idiomarina xiamenensis]|uniref:Lipid A biosynthesis acyltransferase n=1 Tax=Idiomarina xiamenensis 10-D-4 TaxID=740709 RepID=K2K7S7_9GAMM|nr:LpxL/LpxP family Kdo(2)-lipid IV(A) lauroyl/palmitoleoyl acyltransferase [Idiomarina xiamenensis]EKE83698.1 lipid A biosynthesis lauroyl acyltransferase [Idiomarina xiamenensis 10-D-4]
MINKPRFSINLLAPKYWLTWLGVIILYVISWLPYRLQIGLGKGLGLLFYKLVPKRADIARRNLSLSFPDKSHSDIETMTRENMINTGIAFFETGMAWWWPTWRVKRKMHVHNLHYVEQAQAEGKGILMLLFHFLSLEMQARIQGYICPGVGLYRPHNNAVMEFLQTRGRARANKYMVKRTDVRGMLKALRGGDICGYLPDQDYGRKRSVFVPFFAVPDASTTTGTAMFAGAANCAVIPTSCKRREDYSGYDLVYYPPLSEFPSGDDELDARQVNQAVETAIMHAPTQYLWVHRRFKTRPQEDMDDYYR